MKRSDLMLTPETKKEIFNTYGKAGFDNMSTVVDEIAEAQYNKIVNNPDVYVKKTHNPAIKGQHSYIANEFIHISEMEDE